MHSPGFLHVAVQTIPGTRFFTGFQILQKQRALVAHPSHKGQIFSIRRGRGADRTARAADECLSLVVLQINPENLINLAVGIFVVFEALTSSGVL